MKPAEPDSPKPSTDVRPEVPDATRDGTELGQAARNPERGAERDEPARRPGSRANYSFAPGARVLSGYVIKRGLGQGGFGEVYYAVSDAGKDVALKLVRRNLEVELRGVMQCLNVKHPNLIGLYDVKVDDQENHWIVMEYVAGERLTEIIERHPRGMPPVEAIKVLRGIGAGVGYLHDAGIVHRDLKPANIFVENGFIKIGDYGLSKFISSSRRSGQTESVGTVHYMAPEIANGRYGKQIDIYALGVLFYELLTGKLPFDGESVGEILMKHLTAEPDLAAVAEPYRSAIAAALKKDPEQRPRTVAAFLNAIESYDADDRERIATEGPIALDRAAAATSLASRAEQGSKAATTEATAPRGFLAGLFANLVPRGATAKSMVMVGVAMIAGMAIAGAMLPFVFVAIWVWLIVAVVRTLRGDAKQVRSAFREGRGLELRATEAHVDAARPKTFGRRLAMAIGLLVVTAMAFGSIASHRTVERIEVPEVSHVTITDTRTGHDSVTSAGHRDRHFVESMPTPHAGRKIGLIGLVSIVAVGAVVGLSIAVGRKVRSKIDENHALRLAGLENAPSATTLRGLTIDLTGSLLLMFGASIVINRLLLLVLVDQLGATTYLWSTATTFTAVALTALAIKAVRYVDRDSSGRRLMFFAVGAAAGAASWAFADYLRFSVPQDGRLMGVRMGIKASSWPECYVDGVPTVLAFMGYYGLSFLAIDWWNMSMPRRGSRWRVGDVFVAVFWAGAVHFVFPFPQPWGVLTAAGTALVLPFAFPLPPKQKARLARTRYGGRPA